MKYLIITLFLSMSLLSYAQLDSSYERYEKLKAASKKEYVPFFTISNDYQKAIEKAKLSGKPILIYFTGKACINAKKIEYDLLIDPAIQKFCREKLEVITLLVDDRTKLKTILTVVQDGQERKLRTVGNKNAHFQIETFHTKFQPFLVFIDDSGNELNSTGYDPEINTLKDFLKQGKDLYYESVKEKK